MWMTNVLHVVLLLYYKSVSTDEHYLCEAAGNIWHEQSISTVLIQCDADVNHSLMKIIRIVTVIFLHFRVHSVHVHESWHYDKQYVDIFIRAHTVQQL